MSRLDSSRLSLVAIRRAASVFLIAGVLAISTRAVASPTARLVYVRGEGAESCPDDEALRQSVSAHLGYDPFRPFVQTTLFAEVRREGESFVGSVKMVDERGLERGARKLESRGADCSEIMAAMALSMSIAIDPRSALRAAPPDEQATTDGADEPPKEPEPTPAPPAPVSPSPPPDVVRPPPPPIRPSTRGGVGLGAYGVLGEGATATAGARVSGEIVWSKVSAGVELRGALPTSAGIAGGGSVRTSLISGAFVPCRRLAWASVCAIGLVGRIQTETVDVATPASRGIVHVAAGVRLAADIPLDEGFTFRVAADALGTLAPFVVEVDGRRVYQSPAISGLAGASIVYFF